MGLKSFTKPNTAIRENLKKRRKRALIQIGLAGGGIAGSLGSTAYIRSANRKMVNEKYKDVPALSFTDPYRESRIIYPKSQQSRIDEYKADRQKFVNKNRIAKGLSLGAAIGSLGLGLHSDIELEKAKRRYQESKRDNDQE